MSVFEYCHLCDCVIGWLHNATDHTPSQYFAHAPFLEDECPLCERFLCAEHDQLVPVRRHDCLKGKADE
jgi:hypothetical protein